MKVYLDSIGCRLNQSEIERYARQFLAAGHQLVGVMEEAELMVLNSCTVTAAAASDSRQKIRQANKAGVDRIVVTGCMSTLRPKQTAQMPGVIQVVPNSQKDNLVADFLGIPPGEIEFETVARQAVPGSRLKTRAFIKVQDGCDNRCSFCITTLARGSSRSRTVDQVLADIAAARSGGVQEVVLTGVHMGAWGRDFKEAQHLYHLIENILEHRDIPRLRISSLEPWDLEPDFFNLWQDRRLCRHLHLPLQSGCAATLQRMARNTTPQDYAALVQFARDRIPEVAITTDIIVGFPGESEEEFEETLAFVEKMQFAGAHIFTYSARPGTPAAKLPDQVHNYTRKQRNAALRQLGEHSKSSFYQQFIGKTLDVLWESAESAEGDHWHLTGLSDNYLRVSAVSDQNLWNQITPAHLTGWNEGVLQGEILHSGVKIDMKNALQK